MKKALALIGIVAVLMGACGPKPAYKTRDGKKKMKRYNELQYNKADWDRSRKKPKNKN